MKVSMPKMTNTRKAVKASFKKPIDGKVLIVIVALLLWHGYKFYFGTDIHPFWTWVVDASGIVLCILFNIDNPSVANLVAKSLQILQNGDDPMVKLQKVEDLMMSLAHKWDEINQTAPLEMPRIRAMINVFTDQKMAMEDKLTKIGDIILNSPTDIKK
jgi:hypothetical protein